VVDSGTYLLAVPTPIFPEMYEMLRQSGQSSKRPKPAHTVENISKFVENENVDVLYF
jgi:hypothetical protein